MKFMLMIAAATAISLRDNNDQAVDLVANMSMEELQQAAKNEGIPFPTGGEEAAMEEAPAAAAGGIPSEDQLNGMSQEELQAMM